ncbi:MAG: LamG-like jellyroll fold domain-containing protein [Saprospiraceae bacterium]
MTQARKLFFLLLCLAIGQVLVAQTTYTTIAGGNWDNAATWDANGIPPNPVPANATLEIKHVIFNITAKTNNGTINVEGTGPSAYGLLNFVGDFDNFGTFDMKNTFSELRGSVGTFNNKSGGVVKGNYFSLWNGATFNNEAGALVDINLINVTSQGANSLNNAGIFNCYGTLSSYSISYGPVTNSAGAEFNVYGFFSLVNNSFTNGGAIRVFKHGFSLQGTYTGQAGSSIEWILPASGNAVTDYPQFSTFGTIDYSGSTLTVSLANGFEPNGGDIFYIYSGSSVPTNPISLPALSGGKTWKETRFSPYITLEVEAPAPTTPGAALASSGNNQLVSVPDDASLDIECQLSIEFWCKPTSYEDWGAIVMKAAGNSWSGGYGIYLYNSELKFFPTGFGSQHSTGYNVPLNQWTHVAATYDGTDSKVYINGNLISTKTIGLAIPTNNYPMGISGDPGYPFYNFNGHLDEVRVWNKALTQAEIQANMNCEIQTTSDCLVANYHFNQGIAGADNSGVTTLTDASGNGNNGTLQAGYTLNGTTSNWVAPGGVTSGQACNGAIVCEPIVSAPPTCPGNITTGNDPGLCGAYVSFTVGSGDVASPASGSYFPVGTTTVVITGSSGCGAAQTCSFTVTVNDNEAPKFSNCPGNISVNNDTGDCGAEVSWTAPSFSDNCTGATSSSTHDSGDFFAIGTTTVTYSGSDAANNDAIDCSFTVTVNDTEKPSISCAANTTVGTDADECGADLAIPTPDAGDNCQVAEVKARYRSVDENGNATGSWTSRVSDPSGYFAVGRYQIQWRAVDVNDNKKSCAYYLEVEDDEDPVAVCKNVTVNFNGEETISLSASQVWNEAASSDNCAYHYVSTSPSLAIGCDEVGNTVPFTVTISDNAGNTDHCTSYVTVTGLPCGWVEGPQDGSLNCGSNTSADYDTADESFALSADGCLQSGSAADQAAYVYQALCGDGQLTVRLASINNDGYAGLMARESLDPKARRAGILKNYSTIRVRREWRASYGGSVSRTHANERNVKWFRIIRAGNAIKSYTSTNGSSWDLTHKVTFTNLDDCIYLGMMAYSLNGSAEVKAVFDQVSFEGDGGTNSLVDNATLPNTLEIVGAIDPIENGALNIFPNPAKNQVQMVLEGFQDMATQVVVRDPFGRIVRHIKLDSGSDSVLPLDIQNLAAGLYMVSVIQDERIVVSKKLVVQP